MIDFCWYTPILENGFRGCHGNHAFSHSPNRFIFEEHFFSIQGVPGNNLAPMKDCPGNRNINKLYAKLGLSFFPF